MKDIIFTKDFQTFVDGVDMNYAEIYDFYQAVVGNEEGQSTFDVMPANHSEDTLVIHRGMNQGLRLTPNQKKYLPEWIQSKLMKDLDAETFYAMEYAQEKDRIREERD